MRILKEKCSGLIIDIQEKLFPVMAEKELLISNCLKLVEGLRILGVPTTYTQQYSKGLGETVDSIRELYLPFSFIEKNTFSCLDEPKYEAYLQKSAKNTILIAGIESHVCVLQTAVDLQEKGYLPVIISDCISSRNPADKIIALNRFMQEGIRISSVESILFELTRASGTLEFKSISKIIK